MKYFFFVKIFVMFNVNKKNKYLNKIFKIIKKNNKKKKK